jgi:hypothetical protein
MILTKYPAQPRQSCLGQADGIRQLAEAEERVG